MSKTERMSELRELAAVVAVALDSEGDLDVVRQFATEAIQRICDYLEEQGKSQTIQVSRDDLFGLGDFFLALHERLAAGNETGLRLTHKRKPGRPKTNADQQLRRAEAACLAEDYVQAGLRGNQREAIRRAIADMRRFGIGEGLSVRKVERALQEQRRMKR